jgi:RNA polymerase sigma-70 factor (ECF subfamily)
MDWVIALDLTLRHRTRQRPLSEEPAALELNADDALMATAQDDPRAFAVLYERYREPVYLYCFRRLGSPEVADDAASAVFLKAFSARNRYRPRGPRSESTFRSWLFSIAHNVVVDAWRRTRHHARLATDDDTERPIADPGISPEELAMGAEEARAVVALLARLPDRQREAVELRLAGLSTAETAQVLGISVGAAKSLQFRGYQLLRDLLRSDPTSISRELPR